MKTRSIIKKALSYLLVAAMIITAVPAMKTDAAAAKEPSFKVSVADGAMVKGNTKKITVSPKTKIKSYKSSNKKVLKVNKKGKITAVKKGTATITVTAKNGEKAKITIKVFGKKDDMVVNRKIKGKKALWHIKKGKVVKRAGFATDGISWFYINKKGKVDTKKTAVITGVLDGREADWYVKKGKAQLDYSGMAYVNGYTYLIEEGRAVKKHVGKLDAFFGDEVGFKEGETKVIGDEKVKLTLTTIWPTKNASTIFSINGVESEVMLLVEENGYYASFNKYIKDYKLEFTKVEGGKYYVRITERNGEIKKPMAISGKASDRYTTTDYEYIESDNLIIFMDKGVSFDGNVLVKFENYMKRVEKNTGFNRVIKNDLAYYGFQSEMNYIYGNEVFDGVDSDFNKVHVYIRENIHPCCNAHQDYYSYIEMDPDSLQVNSERFNSDFIHEYTHYNHLTNGPSFNPITNEGFAAYIEMKVAREILSDMSEEDFFNEYYYQYLIEEGELTEDGAEQRFIDSYPDGPEHTKIYNYGCIFMEYLFSTYGEKAFSNLFKEGQTMVEKQLEETGWSDLSGENTSKLLKKTYSENIFKDFVKWIDDNPKFTKIKQNYDY